LQERNDLIARLRVERAGRLVREQQAWIVRQRPRDRHPLALAAREGRRKRAGTTGQPDLPEQRLGALDSFRSARAAAEHRHLDVLDRGQHGDQVVELEHEADGSRAVARGIRAVERRAVDGDRPGVGPVERADEVQQRALARSRRAGQGDELARGDA